MGHVNRGFTLLEMMTTVAILGIGSSIAMTSWSILMSNQEDLTNIRSFSGKVSSMRRTAIAGRYQGALIYEDGGEPVGPDLGFAPPQQCVVFTGDVAEASQLQLFTKTGIHVVDPTTVHLLAFRYTGPNCQDPEWRLLEVINLGEQSDGKGLVVYSPDWWEDWLPNTVWFNRDGTTETADPFVMQLMGKKHKMEVTITPIGQIRTKVVRLEPGEDFLLGYYGVYL